MSKNLLEMTVELVAAHLARSDMDSKKVPDFVKDIHGTLAGLSGEGEAVVSSPEAAPAPAPTETPASAETSGPAQAENAASADAAAAEVPSEEAKQEEVTAEEDPEEESGPQLVALPRHNDLSAPEFEGLDTWLAERLTPKTAAKLDPSNKIHPSVYPDHLVCLENGAEVKLLKSYLRKNFDGMTPKQYIEKWNLPNDYPMAPPNYIERKRELARASGLGNKIRAGAKKAPTKAPAKAPAKKKAATANSAGKSAGKTTARKATAKVGTRKKQTVFEGKAKASN